MKAFLMVSLFLVSFSLYSQVPEEYPVHPDAKVKEGVPKGEILKFTFENSKFFPGTWREYWVYVPAQYTPSQPACLYVNQDGVQWQAPTLVYHFSQPNFTIYLFDDYIIHSNNSTVL